MHTDVISVPDISCNHCRMAIEGALHKLEGVAVASVDVAAKRVTVTYDPRVIDQAKIITAIEEQGYTVEN